MSAPLPLRACLVLGGTASLVLGVIGIVVPLLPTTPFVLLAAGCYARAWPPAHRWLRANRFFGPICRSGEEGRHLPPRAKAIAIGLTLASFGGTIAFAVSAWPARAILAVLGALVLAWLVRLPTRPRAMAWGAVFLVWGAAATLGMARADEPSARSAERGYRHILETTFSPAGFDQEIVYNRWRGWPEPLRTQAEGSAPAERRELLYARYGFTPRPDDPQGPPLQFTVGQDGGWHMNCFTCHGGRVDERVIPGLPNVHLALQSLFDDVRSTRLRLGRLPTGRDLAGSLIPFGKTVGTTNAVVFSISLLQWRDRDMNVVPPNKLPRLPHHDLDAPPWWHYHRRSHLYIDGFGKKDHRTLMQFVLVPSNRREKLLAMEPAFRDIEAYIASLRPPAYPYEIDRALAREGEAVFVQHCATCHGTYGPDGRYPGRLVPIGKLGTDRARLDAITPEDRASYADSWLTGYEPEGVVTDPGGYVAPPLDGIWASAPYFHNGSVPTLHAVLHANARPKVWRRDPRAYDAVGVGLRADVADEVPAGLDPHERRRWFDTTQHGKSAAGHLFPEVLSLPARRNLLEYLKTL